MVSPLTSSIDELLADIANDADDENEWSHRTHSTGQLLAAIANAMDTENEWSHLTHSYDQLLTAIANALSDGADVSRLSSSTVQLLAAIANSATGETNYSGATSTAGELLALIANANISSGPSITLSALTIAEDASVGDPVGTFSVVNGSGSYTFTLTDTAGNRFAVDGDDLERGVTALDYESATSHDITVEADNGVDDPISRAFTITVTDVAEGVTWNPLDKSADVVLSNGNLTATHDYVDGNYHFARSTVGHTTGKWHFEFALSDGDLWASGNSGFGLAPASWVGDGSPDAWIGNVGDGTAGYYQSGLSIDADQTGRTNGISYTQTNDRAAIEVDLDAGLFWIKINSSPWNPLDSGDPVTGVGGWDISSITGLELFIAASFELPIGTVSLTANLGGSAFYVPVSAGFTAWDGGDEVGPIGGYSPSMDFSDARNSGYLVLLEDI